MHRHHLFTVFASFLLFLHALPGASCKRLNVLFLVSDDMRPELGAYAGGDFPSPVHPSMHTPHLDALAARSLLLKRAYVQQAVCSPSRTSLLTGRRPDTTRVTDLIHYWRDVAGNFTTIPQYFKQHGYRTVGMGKIFHPGIASGNNDPMSWTDPYFTPKANGSWGSETWRAIPDEELVTNPLTDMITAQHAIKVLRELAPDSKSGKQPFFVAVGFHKPHLPFQFPSSFLKYYPEESIHLPNNSFAPHRMPPIAWTNFDELRDYSDIQYLYGYGDINKTLPDAKVQALRRAYYAAVSYTDALVGKVLEEVKELGLDDETIVSFWGDHGWQLGEHGEWCKHTNFELATHAPMMLRIPGRTDKGIVTEQLTEFVDLFPSLAEAADLPPVPLCPENSRDVELCTEGVSLLPLIELPDRGWKTAVFSQFPRMNMSGITIMGYSIRTTRYRYTEWVEYTSFPNFRPLWNEVYQGNSLELYDHQLDPDENKNVAFEAGYKTVREQLSVKLRAGWRHALPQAPGYNTAEPKKHKHSMRVVETDIQQTHNVLTSET